MNKGLFISIEGPDGSGKSTQMKNIRRFFEDRGFEIVETREPGGTPIGEKIRDILLDRNNSEMNDMTETLLYAASRAQLVSEVILPAVEKGKIVICDRFFDSSLAYQGYGRSLGKSVEDINIHAVKGCIPDITFLLELDPCIGMERIDPLKMDRLESEKIEFHKKVFDGYRKLAERFPERIKRIDASLDEDTICSEIERYLEKLLW